MTEKLTPEEFCERTMRSSEGYIIQAFYAHNGQNRVATIEDVDRATEMILDCDFCGKSRKWRDPGSIFTRKAIEGLVCPNCRSFTTPYLIIG